MWFRFERLSRKPAPIAKGPEKLLCVPEAASGSSAPNAEELASTKITLPGRSRAITRPTLFGDQVEFNFTCESRTFKIYPRCTCGFEAVLLRAYHQYEEVWKICCTRIKYPNETSVCRTREEAVRSWVLLIKLTE